MAILKVIEVLSNSETSWEDATRKAVKEASKTVKDNVTEFRVNIKITFEVK